MSKNFTELYQTVTEKLITFGGKAYPKSGHVVIMAGGSGCLAKGTKILMFDGSYKAVELIEVGDNLMGPDSYPRTVNELYSGTEPMVLIETTKGDSYIVNQSHIHSFICSFNKCGFKKNKIYNMSLMEYSLLPESAKTSLKLYKPDVIEFKEQPENIIDAWLIGFWIGDGTRNTNQFTISDNSETLNHIKSLLDTFDDYSFNKPTNKKPNCCNYSITSDSRNKPNIFRDYFISECQDYTGMRKKIPEVYFTASVEDRKKLLAGLIDSDGYNANGYYSITTKWRELADEINRLCISLGYMTVIKEKQVKWNGEYRTYYNINIMGNFTDLPIVISYKKIVSKKNKDPKRQSFKYTILPEDEYFGFSLEEDDKRFILENGIVTHNSGKGFIKDNLLGIEGFTFDVDAIKELAIKTKSIVDKVKDQTGYDISKFDLGNTNHVSILHDIVGNNMRLSNKKLTALYASILASPSSDKPNLIFDVTLKDLQKLESISSGVSRLGYDKRNIHIVWVLNDIEVAKVQNQKRTRKVDVDILVNTHQGVSQTMAQIISMNDRLNKYMDGSIVVAFNQIFVDTELVKSPRGGSYIKNANYVTLKKQGEPPLRRSELSDIILNKIAAYAPPVSDWSWN